MAKTKAAATLTLTITFEDASLPDIIEFSKEIIEKVTEQAKVEGYLDINRTSRIDVDDLR